MNKTLKKVFSLAAASAMSLTLAATTATSFVYADNANISVIDSTSGDTYSHSSFSAYQLMTVTQDASDSTKLSYTLNSTYKTAVLAGLSAVGNTSVSSSSDADDIVTAVKSSVTDDNVRKFADAVYSSINSDNSITKADATSTNGTFSVPYGYYLIVENVEDSDKDDVADATSLVMLDTAATDTWTVKLKKDVPELQKKVIEKNDSTGVDSSWQDAADYDIGDTMSFQLKATLPDNYTSYSNYYLQFNDTATNMENVTITAAYIDVNGDGAYTSGTDTDLTSYFTLASDTTTSTVDSKKTTTTTFTYTDDDLSDDGISYTNSEDIYVEYTATLSDTANIGAAGNPNVAYLTFSNNPYNAGSGDTDNTPDDKVTVFTYTINANKVDGSGNALSGAGFTLYKYDADTSKYVKVSDEITNTTTFAWTGLDAGNYMLSETTVPAGYNQAEDLYFNIVATYDVTADDPKLLTLNVQDTNGNTLVQSSSANGKFTTDTTTATRTNSDDTTTTYISSGGTLTTTIQNTSGNELPDTGGIGTTMFYVVGGGLVAVAVVLLISKKRASAE